MSRGKRPEAPPNVVKFPGRNEKVEQSIIDRDGNPRLTEISKGGWSSWEHMASDLVHSIASGDLEPLGMVVIVFDQNVGTLVLRRDVTRGMVVEFLRDYVEAQAE